MTAPLRIKELALRDYRAFPGPAEYRINLDGRNLLVYGENGSGKSSIYHALSDFFSINHPALGTRRHVFSPSPTTDCRVAVRFVGDAADTPWAISPAGVEAHPCDLGDNRVRGAALRRSCLDYRALLDTNYGHGARTVDLFEIARDRLLAEFPATVEGGLQKTIAELWKEVLDSLPKRRTEKLIDVAGTAARRFNKGFQQALDAIATPLKDILKRLGQDDLIVEPFVFGGLTYDRQANVFVGTTLPLHVTYRAHVLDRPQHFLNEARLSALGLAIYLAGRLASVPSAPSSDLKLLVLDDVLIGLDQDNRVPVLQVIRDLFGDWQVVLLTHDLYWFEIVRQKVVAGDWCAVTMRPLGGIPSIQPLDTDPVTEALDGADRALGASDFARAGNEARAGAELLLQRFCQKRKLPVPYMRDATKLKVEVLFAAAELFAKDRGKAAAEKVLLEKALQAAKGWRSLALNPLSHAGPPSVDRVSIQHTIQAVRDLDAAMQAVNAAMG